MNRPYEIQIWAGDYRTLGAFATFDAALAAYRRVRNSTKQLINVALADSGRDGLTTEQRDQLAEAA